jgi:hypothetical protein
VNVAMERYASLNRFLQKCKQERYLQNWSARIVGYYPDDTVTPDWVITSRRLTKGNEDAHHHHSPEGDKPRSKQQLHNEKEGEKKKI